MSEIASRHSYRSVAAAALGRWPEILAAVGVDRSALSNRHGPCPGCGGKDRFRFDDKDGRGRWVCGQGGDPISGDGFQLIEHVLGCDNRESLRRVAHVLGLGTDRPVDPLPPPKRPVEPPQSSATQRYGLSIWDRVERDDSVVADHPYAKRKGIDWHAGIGRARASGRKIGSNADCLVVPIRSVRDGTIAAVQCINTEGAKQTFGPIKGAAFQLGNVHDLAGNWYVVEGAADAISTFRSRHRAIVFGAMGLGSCDALAKAVAHRYQPRRIVVMEDGQ
jgi:phage/plasmid primase-like uncharacterized protein